jgi:hypothetical protein
MTEEVASLLTENMGEIRDEYSGRGMFGKTTYAVVFDSQGEFQRALLYAAYSLGENGADDAEGLLKELCDLGIDSMGLGIVVY